MLTVLPAVLVVLIALFLHDLGSVLRPLPGTYRWTSLRGLLSAYRPLTFNLEKRRDFHAPIQLYRIA
jgi:hypothetical protein